MSAEDSTRLHRALKEITDGESKKIVGAGPDGDGYGAWRRLNAHFEPGLASQQGSVAEQAKQNDVGSCKYHCRDAKADDRT